MSTREIEIPYPGKSKKVSIPENNILTMGLPKNAPKVTNVRAKILERLRSPIAIDPLPKRVKKGKSVSILVDDITRQTPISEVLPVVIDELVENGVAEKDIKIWIATGMHRLMNVDEQKEKIGREIYERFETRAHNCEDKKNLVFFGETSRGTPIWLNKAVVESDTIIGIGGILLHWFAGYGGGAKIILPGISGRETVVQNHNILEPTCAVCNLEGNPIRKEMEEAARKANLYMKIDCVMNSDNELVDLYAGDFVKAHREAVKKYNDIYGVPFPRKAEIILTSTMPKYITFTQGILMPLCTMRDLTTEDATFIIDCPAIEGYAFSKPFTADMKARLTVGQLKQRVMEGTIIEGITLYHAARIRDERNVIVVSKHVTEDEMVQTGFKHASTIEEALEKAFARHGKEAKIAIVPYGFSSVPMFEKDMKGGCQ